MALNGIKEALEYLVRFIELLEAYEKRLWTDQCECASQAVIHVAAALQNVSMLTAEGQYALEVLRKQVAEARLQIAAFTPHAQSTELWHLRQRRTVATYLREVITAMLAIIPSHVASEEES